MRLPGHVLGGDDSCPCPPRPCRVAEPCAACAVAPLCSSSCSCGSGCRCSNYVRTGDVCRPDGLLCALDHACLRESVKVLEELGAAGVRVNAPPMAAGLPAEVAVEGEKG